MQAQPQHEYLDREQGIGTWLGLLPFVLFGLLEIVYSLPHGWWGERTSLASLRGLILILGYLVILAGLYYGIKAGFHCWAYPYLGYGVLFALSMSSINIPRIELLWFEISGWQLRVARGLVPLLALVLLLWRAGFDLGHLVDDLEADWTRFSFGLYILLPFIILVWMDGLGVDYKLPGLILAESIFTLGAFLYLRQRSRRGRLLSLLTCAFTGFLAGAGVAHLYWSTYSVNMATGQRSLLPGPLPIIAILLKSVWNAFLATLFVLSPGILGLLRNPDRQPGLDSSLTGNP
jgi:hypothetical protein